jgi:hypothetical protein
MWVRVLVDIGLRPRHKVIVRATPAFRASSSPLQIPPAAALPEAEGPLQYSASSPALPPVFITQSPARHGREARHSYAVLQGVVRWPFLLLLPLLMCLAVATTCSTRWKIGPPVCCGTRAARAPTARLPRTLACSGTRSNRQTSKMAVPRHPYCALCLHGYGRISGVIFPPDLTSDPSLPRTRDTRSDRPSALLLATPCSTKGTIYANTS